MKKILILTAVLLAMSSSVSAQFSIKPVVFGGVTNGGGDGLDGYSGWHLGAKAKYGILVLPISVTAHYDYNKLSKTVSTVKVEPTIMTYGIGVEYSPLPLPVAKPFVSVDYSLNNTSFSGGSSSSNSGLGFGVGAEIGAPGFPLSFEVEAKYRMLGGSPSANLLQLSAGVSF